MVALGAGGSGLAASVTATIVVRPANRW